MRLPFEVVEAQAKRIGVPLMIRGADWKGYEEQFLDAMKECVESGISHGVFGDIDLEDHLEWVRKTCAKVDMEAVHPLMDGAASQDFGRIYRSRIRGIHRCRQYKNDAGTFHRP